MKNVRPRNELLCVIQKGTLFQQKVWKEILNIPPGRTRTYKEIAIAIGHPKAYRAVGNACNRNPFPVEIPCHRVIESNGRIGGYVRGVKEKAMLLKAEKVV